MAFSLRLGLTGAALIVLALGVASAAEAGTTTYAYDAQGQVKAVVRSNQTVTYSYDAAGNRAALSATAPLAGRGVAKDGSTTPGSTEPTLPVLPQLLSKPQQAPASSTQP